MDEQFKQWCDSKGYLETSWGDTSVTQISIAHEAWNAAYSLGLAKGRKEGAPRGRGEGIAAFICYLIDNHETETITEERLQQIYAAFIKADAICQAAQGGEGGGEGERD